MARKRQLQGELEQQRAQVQRTQASLAEVEAELTALNSGSTRPPEDGAAEMLSGTMPSPPSLQEPLLPPTPSSPDPVTP